MSLTLNNIPQPVANNNGFNYTQASQIGLYNDQYESQSRAMSTQADKEQYQRILDSIEEAKRKNESEADKTERIIKEQYNALVQALKDGMNANQLYLKEINDAASSNAWTEAKNFNHNEAVLQRQWLERMSNTAHQREIEDLKAAGINPLLTGKYGGASTPGATAASISSPQTTAAHSSDAAENVIAIVTLLGSLVSSASGLFKALLGKEAK